MFWHFREFNWLLNLYQHCLMYLNSYDWCNVLYSRIFLIQWRPTLSYSAAQPYWDIWQGCGSNITDRCRYYIQVGMYHVEVKPGWYNLKTSHLTYNNCHIVPCQPCSFSSIKKILTKGLVPVMVYELLTNFRLWRFPSLFRKCKNMSYTYVPYTIIFRSKFEVNWSAKYSLQLNHNLFTLI